MTNLSFRRLIIILYIISFAVSLFIYANVMENVVVPIEYTNHRQYTVIDSTVYLGQNDGEDGSIYAINSNGRVRKVVNTTIGDEHRILAMSSNDEIVYTVLSTSMTHANTSGDKSVIEMVPAYCIVCYDKNLNYLAMTPNFVVDNNLVISGFSAEDTGMYMTFISRDRQTIKVYNISNENLREEDDDPSAVIKIDGVRSKRAGEKRFFADAQYSLGQLYVRTDKDIPEGIFAIDPFLESIISNLKIGVFTNIKMYAYYNGWYVTLLIIWLIVLYLIARMLRDKNRTVYYLVIAEVVLLIVIGMATGEVAKIHKDARETERTRFAATSLLGIMDDAGIYERADYSDNSYYDTERYGEIKDTLAEFVNREGNSDIFKDVLVVRLKDEVVCASTCGRNQEVITDIYGSALEDIKKQMNKGSRFASVDFKNEGFRYRAIGVADSIPSPDYALVGVIDVTIENGDPASEAADIIFLFIAIFGVASAIVVLIWYLHMRDFIALEKALADTAEGNSLSDRPITLGRDVKEMWDAVEDVQKRVKGMEYSKLRIFEAYYRFAPKNIELLMEKNSIVEVKNGDSRQFNGTLGCVKTSVESAKKLKNLGGFIDAVGEYVRSHEAMIIGKDIDLSNMQLLFSDKEDSIIRSLVNIYGKLRKNDSKNNISMLLYNSSFTFGVLGNEESASLYVYFDDKDLAGKVLDIAYRMNLGLVISEGIYQKENYDGKVRFIGYGGRDSRGNLVGIYEVLDSHSEKERSQKLAVLDRFNAALQLFYNKEFYQARNKFSDIFKETPEDELVRWYIFACEEYLHKNTEGDDFKILNY
ncbi:MAG: hypothetical protein J6O61_10590 [Butyrivibrio sp.]|uniref:hypothetical protein n=1 Tax=Butyrivibrio sp. TaxID=28121 RepID=UPI001B1CE61E|nr:hypothetical protein [Butyrivibrio sp.]MBO6241257.1 hypothetical protein [Butyrivibrio sp.]